MKFKTLLITSLAASSVTAVAFAGSHGGKLLEYLDTNKDGLVTKVEMQTAAAERISAADQDGDGAASAEELKEHFRAEHEARRTAKFAEKDANGDGSLSRDEVSQMPQEIFERIDQNGDGSLSQAELSAMKGKHRKASSEHHTERAAKIFEKLDANQDGLLSKDELERMPQERFTALDTDGDGSLTQAEMAAGRRGPNQRAGKGGHGGPAGHFSKADTNGDGNVDVEEARALAGKQFDRLDKSGDGVLVAEELRHGKTRHGKMGHGKRRDQRKPSNE